MHASETRDGHQSSAPTPAEQKDAERVRIESTTARDRILRTIVKAKLPWIHRDADGGTFSVGASRPARDTLDLLPQSEEISIPSSARASFSVRVGRAQFELDGAIDRTGPHLEFGKNCDVYSLARRRSPRIPWMHEIAFQTRRGAHRHGSILDIGPGGVAMSTRGTLDVGDEVHFFGLMGIDPPLSNAVVRWRRASATGVTAGLEFIFPLGGQALEVLVREYFPRLFSRSEFSETAVHTLLADSGYLGLDPDVRMTQAWLRLDDHEIGRDMVYIDEDGHLVGHMSLTRAYRHTWTAHQLASVSNHHEVGTCWRELYRFASIWPRLADPRPGALAAIFPLSPWNRRMLYGFSEWLDQPDNIVVTRLERFLLPEVLDDSDHDPAVVHPAGLHELGEVEAALPRYLPALAIENMDLTEGHLRSSALHPNYAKRNIIRRRDVLVLKRGDQTIATALCELADPALSLFNLFNATYVFPVDAALTPTSDEILQLLLGIDHVYRKNVLQLSMLLVPEEWKERMEQAKCRYIENVGLVNWSPLGLRHFENYIELMFERTARKKSKSSA